MKAIKEKVRYMEQASPQRLGEYVKKRRIELGMSGREFARRIEADTAYVVRLERGEYKAPRPDMLKNIAEALKLPLSDVYAVAGFLVPCDLPTLVPYLRTRYGQLSDEAITALDSYFLKIAADEGLDLSGPAPGEDETPFTRPEEIDPDDLK